MRTANVTTVRFQSHCSKFLHLCCTKAKLLVTDWGLNRLWHRVKVDCSIGLPMVHVLESTLESTYGEFKVYYGRIPDTKFLFEYSLREHKPSGQKIQ